MMYGYLKASGTVVQQKRVRRLLAEIDPVGTARRWGKTVSRRVYEVAGSNSLWHMDAHMKLIRLVFEIAKNFTKIFCIYFLYKKCNMYLAGLKVFTDFSPQSCDQIF